MSKRRSRQSPSSQELVEAIVYGSLPDVKGLVLAGADVNQADSDGFTPLMFAVCSKKSELSSYLIEGGADVNARNDIGQTPLMMAAKEGRKEIVQKLISCGADLNSTDDEHRNAIAWSASWKDSPEVISMLGANGADCNLRDIRGLTPLMRASLMGFSKSVGALLTLGADESITFRGKTAYEMAAEKGHQDVCRAIEKVLKDRSKQRSGR